MSSVLALLVAAASNGTGDGSLSVALNPDGTYTITGTGVAANPDGTYTITGSGVAANPDGTYTIGG